MTLLKTLFGLMLVFNYAKSDDILVELYEYNYKGNNCTTGLMVDTTLILEGRLHFPGDISEGGTYIVIEFKRFQETDFHDFEVIIENCYESDEFFCQPLENTTKYDVFLHTKANVLFNQTEWRLKGVFKKREFVSRVVRLPKIYNHDNILITVNGQDWSHKHTSITADTKRLTVCCKDAPLPCEAVIQVNSQSPVTGSPCVTYVPEASMGLEQSEVRVGFRACGIVYVSQIQTLDLKMGDQSENIKTRTLLLCILGVLQVNLIVILIICIKVYCGRKIQKEDQQNMEESYKLLPPGHNNQRKDKTTYVNLVPESCTTVVKPQNKGTGKKNKGAKPSKETGPDKSGDSVPRKRSISESENIVSGRRNISNVSNLMYQEKEKTRLKPTEK